MRKLLPIVLIVAGLLAPTANADGDKSTILHNGEVFAVRWSPDSEMVAVQGVGGVWVYSAEQQLQTRVETHSYRIGGGVEIDIYSQPWGTGVDWSPDGERLIAPFYSFTSNPARMQLRIWKPDDGAIERTLFSGNASPAVDWSPDGEFVSSGWRGYDDIIRSWVWNVAVWQLDAIEDFYNPHNFQSEIPVHDLEWSNNENILAVGYADGSLRIEDFTPDNTISEYTSQVYMVADTSITDIAWNPLQQLVACATGKSILIWDVQSGDVVLSLESSQSTIEALDWNSDGTLLASAGGDKFVYIWDADREEIIATLEGHFSTIVDLDWSPDDRYIVTASRDGTARLWEVDISR